MKTQAWGLLTAAVLAAGLKASYHNGGLQWAHRIADRVGRDSGAVIALATGHADRFLAEARALKANEEAASCPLAGALAQLRSGMPQAEEDFSGFEVMAAREQAQMARIEANRARIEAHIARIHIPVEAFNPVVVAPKVRVCPRIHVSVPRPPMVRIPAMPAVHVDALGAGTV